MEDYSKQPVSNVEWVHRDTLIPNDYNPNHVAPPELALLELSILEDGWTQPIVRQADGTIVDGFHRYTVSGHPALMERFGGMVPTVTVALDPVHRKMSTIRHNRARGQHGITPMANIVSQMLADGVPRAEMMERLGMEREEIDRLCDRAGMPQASGSGFGKSWVPA